MRGARRMLASGVVLPAALGLLSVAAAAASDVRTDLETLGLALDSAVFRVSRPARLGALPRGVARGYRIAGFGAMFVLSPRTLPVPKRLPTAAERDASRVRSAAAAAFDQQLSEAASPEARQQLRQDVRAQRRAEMDQHMRDKVARRAAGETDPSAPGAAPPVATPRSLEEDLKQFEQDVQVQLRLQAEAARMLMGDGLASMPADARVDYERQMRELHDQAESFRLRVERRRQAAEQSVLATLGVASPSQALVPATSATTASAPMAEAPMPSPAAPAAEGPSIQPWSIWSTPHPEPVADPSEVIRNVGVAVARVLETQGGRLAQLPPQESVAVAIDFVPATAQAASARPARTLLVRVLKADIDARAAGLIDATEFTRRVEIVEY
ncbi:MAG: hypothetical protein ABW221_22085 [Vicinamibacteria bacterium]